MSYLRLLKFGRPCMITPRTIRGASSRMFNDPFFTDPFFTSNPYTSSSRYLRDLEKQHFENMNEMMREFNEVFEAFANPSYTNKKGISEKADKKVADKAGQKEENLAAQTSKTDKTSSASSNPEAASAETKVDINAGKVPNSNANTTTNTNKQTIASTEPSKKVSVNNASAKVQSARNTLYDRDLEFFSLFPRSRSVSHTYNRAEKLLDQASSGKSETNEKPSLTLEETNDLLKGSEDFNNFGLNTFGKNSKNMKFSGTSYESSTIFKNGRAVTVSKHSTFNPDGTIRTEVNQEYVDDKGQKDSRKWVKEDDSYKEKIENVKGEVKQELGQL